ncbi:MAG: glutamine synthetase family protein [Pseudomonadota bacterium]
MSWLDDFPGAHSIWTAVADLNGQARGKRLPASRSQSLPKATAKMPLSALSLDVFGDDVEDSPLVFESGDQDGFLRPTDRGAVWMPWLSSPSLLVPMVMEHGPGRPFYGDPRRALSGILDRYADHGWTVQAATELEFYLVEDDSARALTKRLGVGGDILGLQSLEAYDAFLTELYACCDKMGLPVEASTSESGKGQFEVTLTHGPALHAADNTWLFKMLVRGLARKHGMAATFMAKPFAKDAGNGLHIHASVLDANGQNLFDDGSAFGSDRLRHAVGGCLSLMRDATLIFAPHENSYHRLVPGAHAPTGICWGYENRTAAIRIPAGPGHSRRIEHRVAGGDTNPYLLFAAVLGSALLGIEDAIDPPPPLDGDAYAADIPSLARSWSDAVDAFQRSAGIARIFPQDLIDQFMRTKRQEIRRIEALSPVERQQLYFDRV